MKGIASKFIQQGKKGIIYHHVYYLSGHFYLSINEGIQTSSSL